MAVIFIYFYNYLEIMRSILFIGVIREWRELSTYDFKNWSLLLEILEPFNFGSVWWKSFQYDVVKMK